MSDKLSDEQIEAAKAAGFSWHPIWQCLVVRHSNGAWSEVSDKLARFAALLAASPAPAIPADERAPIVEQLADARKLLAHASEFAMMQLDEDWHERAAALLALPAPAVSASAPPAPGADVWVPKSLVLPPTPGWYLVMLAPDNDWELMSDTPIQVEFGAYKHMPQAFTHFYDGSPSEDITEAVTYWTWLPKPPRSAPRPAVEVSLDPISTSPRVDELIAGVMKRFPGQSRAAQARYFEEVHQHLGPLARELEAEAARLRVALYSTTPAILENGEVPSFTSQLTPYGLLVRALRIVAGTTLYAMGQSMGLSPATLSAMEFGRREVRPEHVGAVSDFFQGLGLPRTAPLLIRAVDASREGGKS
ncbi:helix-turn-helix domain-containing protein [Burkholderia gladioli]|uniref:helix-turn-helix domain-containing protein n=1 Tax=Burkholderia gladioli TaxID=28095 RepID=UPI0016408DD2|nr:helix-turn-helix transcriptional regulator [Burkholderia gladioli]